MSVTMQIDQAAGVIISVVEGDVSAEDVLSAMDEVQAHADFRPSMNVLWDLTDADFIGGKTDQLRSVVDGIANRRDKRGTGYRVAIVAPSDVAFGVSRQYEAFADRLPFSLRVFREKDEAWQWLVG